MPTHPPPLTLIRSFESAARNLSFTKAALELGYTQAAISTHVRALETHLGRALFVRGTRSLSLTELGEAFLPTLRQALEQIDNATEAIRGGARGTSVVLSCPMSLAENWLPSCLKSFTVRHPQITVTVNGTVWTSPDDRLADVTITVNRDDDAPDGAHRLWRDRLVLLCPPAFAAQLSTPADLQCLPRIMVAGRQDFWPIMARALDIPAFGLGDALRTNATNVALEMAAHGVGWTISLESLAAVYLGRNLLVQPFRTMPESPWSYYMARRNAPRGTAAARLADHIRTFASSGERDE